MTDIEIKLIKSEVKSFDQEEINQLKDSINTSGLLHPITVLERQGYFEIIAGERRLEAYKQLSKTTIPAKIFPETTPKSEIDIIKLHENLRRHNIPWYEEVELENKLHELRQLQFGVAKPGRYGKNSGWTVSDTARELSMSMGRVSQDIDLATTLKRNPNLKLVHDKTTAMKLIKETTKREVSEIESLMPSDYEMNQVFLGDSSVILKEIPNNTFEACITDPPWTEYSRDLNLTRDDVTVSVFKEVYRVLKRDSFLYAFVSSGDFFLYKAELTKLGFKVQDYPLIWQKTRTITHGRAPWEYSRDYEPIILAVKGNPVLSSPTEISSIMTYPNMHYTKMIHPHEKPKELIEQLIKNCTFEGAKILDPFGGSGVLGSAAKELRREYIIIERQKGFYDNIVARLK